jgi:hypothetical protein
MSKCGQPDCLAKAISSCSVCEKEQYCSSSCQKLDWRIHKSMCPILKKLSTKLQPFHEVIQIKDEILASKKGDDVRVLEHILLYLETTTRASRFCKHLPVSRWSPYSPYSGLIKFVLYIAAPS